MKTGFARVVRLLVALTILVPLAGASLVSRTAEANDRRSWAVWDGDHFFHISAKADDFQKVARLSRSEKEPFVWVRDGLEERVIRDPALIAETLVLLEAPEELEIESREVERLNREIVRQERDLGREVGRLLEKVN